MTTAKTGVSYEVEDKVLRELVLNLCENVKFYREKVDISQKELASRSGVSESTISELEQFRAKNFSGKTVALLAKPLKLSDPLKLLKKRKKG